MVGWSEMCEVTEERLDRKLVEQEIDFLKWVYDMHLQEEIEVELKTN